MRTLRNEDGEFWVCSDDWKCYRKRPVIIQARQMDREFWVETLEGTMHGNAGDWLIKGINGEFYPCKPDIFDKTYEVAP